MPTNSQMADRQDPAWTGSERMFVSHSNIPLRFDVACLGELVIDLAPATEPDGRCTYEPKAGGAPGNVAVALARLGNRVAMIAKVGDEAFGQMITRLLDNEGINTSGIVRTSAHRTSLAFVVLGPAGEREFIFYRENAADMFFEAAEIDTRMIAESAVLHVNTVMLLGASSRRAQASAIAASRQAGRLLSVDLNFRRSLWSDQEEMVALGRDLVAQADILKLTEDELQDIALGDTVAERVENIWHEQLRVCAVTKGAAGAEIFTPTAHVSCDGFRVAAVDTTGAGDAFAASMLSELTTLGFDLGSTKLLENTLRRACAAGALSTMHKGAMESMPNKLDIDDLLRRPLRIEER